VQNLVPIDKQLSTGIHSAARDAATIACCNDCTPGQLALAWLLYRGEDFVPIPGTKRKDRLVENIGTLSVDLSADELRRISDAVPAGAAAGTRYPEGQMGSVYL